MLTIIHHPKGLDHPYEQLPEERFPRAPLADQPFTVGIATRPPCAARSVTVHARVGDTPAQTFPAEHVPDWQPKPPEGVGAEYLERQVEVEQDVWRVDLTAPPHGETLTYWIEADGQTSAANTLRGETWQPSEGDRLPLTLEPGGSGQWQMYVSRHDQDAQHAQNAKLDASPPAALPTVHCVEWLGDGTHTRRVRITFGSAPDEAFYGLGERFNALNQRGEVLDIRCYEQYKSQGKRTYMPVPFLLSSAGYGVHVDSARWMQFDLAATQPDRWTLEADLGPDASLDLTWFTGDAPLEIVSQFARRTGPAALPPLWAFGLWMSANEWNSQARVVAEVEQSFTHDIIPSVLVIEAWSDETTFYIWNDAQYRPMPGDSAPRYSDFTFPEDGKWPDPKGMIDWLHGQDIRLVLWQLPVLKASEGPHAQHDADRAYFEREGFGVRQPDGSFYTVRPFWFRNGYLWDVSNPAAREWWLNKRAYLLEDLGIDGFKTDGGEHLWGSEMQFADGRTGAELWNAYPQLYTEAYYQFTTAKRDGDALTFSRAGFTGSQRSPAHWAGDENSTWDAYRASILAGLSAGLSGIPFWGWDIGGFSGPIPTAELCLRGTAMATFCPIMQYHAEFNQHREPKIDRTPWNIQARTGDDRVIPTFRFFANVRHNLMPYIWQEAQHAAATGEPMMRPLALWHADASPYDYLFGRDLLVCPVVDEGVATRSVSLPDGDWYDLWTGEHIPGGQTIEVPVALDTIPVYVRAGATIPLRFPEGGTWGDYIPLGADATTTLAFG